MKKYGTIEKRIGETPLEALERFRLKHHFAAEVPLAYAGRLDPMASGTLLILIGSECKRQEQYHGLDKEYRVEILFGIQSDTGDVLGLVEPGTAVRVEPKLLKQVLKSLTGDILLPYPHFSSKTVRGKPLHVWTLEGALNEIEIPVKKSRIHSLTLRSLKMVPLHKVVTYAREKIETVTQVTATTKALGRDFRRTDVRAGWERLGAQNQDTSFVIATVTCRASSGTYMRSLAEEIGKRLGTCALAYSIHRTRIGKYIPLGIKFGLWSKSF